MLVTNVNNMNNHMNNMNKILIYKVLYLLKLVVCVCARGVSNNVAIP